MTEYIELVVKVPKTEADLFIARFGRKNVEIMGYLLGEEIVRCRDCEHSHKDGTLCNLFASWEPIAGGDEYEYMPVEVELDGFCAWGVRRDAE